MSEKELILRIKTLADTAGFKAVQEKAEGLQGMLGGLAKTGLMMGAGVLAGAGLAAGALLTTIGPAEALGDAQDRVTRTFAESSSAIQASAEAQSNALGLTRTEYLASADALGVLLNQQGLSKKASADMAQQYTELVPKLAAYKGVENEVVQSAFESAVRGKTKALGQLGILIDDDAIKAKALEMGLVRQTQVTKVSEGADKALEKAKGGLSKAQEKYNQTVAKYGADSDKAKSAAERLASANDRVGSAQEKAAGKTTTVTSALTDQAKAAALQALILEKSGDAVAGWEGNSQDVETSVRRITKGFSDMQAEVGQRLLPIVAPLIAAFAERLPAAFDLALGWFDQLTGKGSLIGNVLSGAQQAVSSFMEGFNLEPDMPWLDRIQNGLANIGPLGQTVADALQPISDFLSGVSGSDAPDLIGRIADGLRAIGGDDTPAFFVALASALEHGKSAWDALMVAAQPWIARAVEIASNGEVIKAVLLAIAIVAIPPLIAGFLAWAASAGAAAVATVTALAPVLIPIGLIAAGILLLRKAWDTNFGGIQEKTAQVFKVVGDWIDKAKRWFDELVARFKSGDWAGIAGQIAGMLAGGLRSGAGLVGTAFRWLVDKGVEVFRGIDWNGIARSALDLLKSGLVGAAHLIGQAFGTLMRLAADVITKTDWKKVAVDGLKLLGVALFGAQALVLDAFGKLIKAAGEVIVKTDWVKVARDTLMAMGRAFLAAKSILTDIGKSLIDGLISGITGNQGRANSAMDSAAQGLIDTTNRRIKRRSPPRIFVEIGMAIMLALALGISSNGALAYDAMTAQVDRLLEIRDRKPDFDQLWADLFSGFTEANNQVAGSLKNLIFGAPSMNPTPSSIGKYSHGADVWRDAQAAAGEYYLTVLDYAKRLNEAEGPERKRAAFQDLYRSLEEWENKRHEQMTAGLEQWLANAPGTLGWMKEAEDKRHELFMKNLGIEGQAIADLQQRQADYEAMYAEALRRAQEAIRTAQAAAEKREDLVHAGVLEHIDEQARAFERAHSDRLAALDRLKTAEDDRHNAATRGFEAERQRWADHLAAQEAGVKRITDREKEMEVQLGRLKLDLNIDAEEKKLSELERRVSDFQSVLGKLDVVESDPRKAADEAMKRARERIALTTEEQRRMLQSVKGTLAGEDLRTAELLLQGHALKAQTVRDLMARIEASLQAQADAQQGVVDGKQAQLDALSLEIEKQKQLGAEAGLLLEKEKVRVQVILDGIASRDALENARHEAEAGRLAGLVSAENSAYELAKQHIEDLRAAEATRHTDRMREIGEEFAMQLFMLDHTAEEAAAMVAAAAEQARQIGDEAARIFASMGGAAEQGKVYRGVIQDAEAPTAGVANDAQLTASGLAAAAISAGQMTVELTKSSAVLRDMMAKVKDFERAEGVAARSSRKLNQTTLRGRGGFRFTGSSIGDDNDILPDTRSPGPYAIDHATVHTATIESVDLRMEAGDTHVYIDGRELGRAVRDAMVDDPVLLDAFNKALDERKAKKGTP